MKKLVDLVLISFMACSLCLQRYGFCQSNQFNYSPYLFGNPHTLSVSVGSINVVTGLVQLGGVDLQSPRTPFTWEWGDGTVNSGFFPQSHTYNDRSHNYVVTVIAHYSSGAVDSVQTEIHFILPTVNPISLPGLTAVTIPSTPVTLTSHWPEYAPPELSCFTDNFFKVVSRSCVEYVLSAVASIEMDFVNDNVYLPNDDFEQVVLRDSTAGGAYSIWFSTPVAFGAGDAMFEGTPSYSSLFHEMGHNFTLNFPAQFPYGGRIDGNANAIYSESMAQIFQHAAGYELVNNAALYGLDSDLVFDIRQSLISSIETLRQAHDKYVTGGAPFASWNDPSTPTDETFGTFMTIAYEFCAQAESLGTGYRGPVKRLTKALAQFDSSRLQAYDPSNNTASADSFRATLMVSALSYAFEKDLRGIFKALKFPINDYWYNQLTVSVRMKSDPVPRNFKVYQNYPNPFNPSTLIMYELPENVFVTLKVYDILGREMQELVCENQNAGDHSVILNGRTFSSGVYFYRLQAGSYSSTKEMLLIK